MSITTVLAIVFFVGALLGFAVGYLLKSVTTEKPQWLIEQEQRELAGAHEMELNKRKFDGPPDHSVKIYHSI